MLRVPRWDQVPPSLHEYSIPHPVPEEPGGRNSGSLPGIKYSPCMRHNTVLRRGESGPYHYVSSSTDGAHPHEGCTPACTHETSDEAYEHHRTWLLDNLRAWEEKDVMRRCDECDEYTTRRVDGPGMNMPHMVLCNKHDDRAVAEALRLPPGTKLDSYGS